MFESILATLGGALLGGGQQQQPQLMKYQGAPPAIPMGPMPSLGAVTDPSLNSMYQTGKLAPIDSLDKAREAALKPPSREPAITDKAVTDPGPATPAQPGAMPPTGKPADAAKLGGAAGAAAQKPSSTFLGMDGGQWAAIGTASGILASLFQQSQAAPQVLNPSMPMDTKIPLMPLGGDLGGGMQRVSGLSQFAISPPSLGQPIGGQSDILSQLRKLGVM
jgi:hypothetical protein